MGGSCCSGVKPNPLALPHSTPPPCPEVTPKSLRVLTEAITYAVDDPLGKRAGENVYLPISNHGEEIRTDWQFRNLTAENDGDYAKSIYVQKKGRLMIFRDADSNLLAVLCFPQYASHLAWLAVPFPLITGQHPVRDLVIDDEPVYHYMELHYRHVKVVNGQLNGEDDPTDERSLLWETTYFKKFVSHLTFNQLILHTEVRDAREDIKLLFHHAPSLDDKKEIRVGKDVDPVVYFAIRLAHRSFQVDTGEGYNQLYLWAR